MAGISIICAYIRGAKIEKIKIFLLLCAKALRDLAGVVSCVVFRANAQVHPIMGEDGGQIAGARLSRLFCLLQFRVGSRARLCLFCFCIGGFGTGMRFGG
jgi:hypothetical protein